MKKLIVCLFIVIAFLGCTIEEDISIDEVSVEMGSCIENYNQCSDDFTKYYKCLSGVWVDITNVRDFNCVGI